MRRFETKGIDGLAVVVVLLLSWRTLHWVAETGVHAKEEDGVLLWASSGGGWRSMIVDMAYANVFAQAGLMDSSQSRFTAISSNSGASWFTTQLFYSATFYDQVTASSTDVTLQFIEDWLQSYEDFLNGIPSSPVCFFLSPLERQTILADASDFCDALNYFNGSFASFIEAMLRRAATNYGDASFPDRIANGAHRVAALQNTDLLLQTSLAPNARYAYSDDEDISFVGPADANFVFSVPLSTQFVVQTKASFFSYAVEPERLPLLAHWSIPGREAQRFRYSDWYGFHIEDPTSEGFIYADPGPFTQISGPLSAPFRGQDPTVTQVAAASSSILASGSALLPSLLAQLLTSRSGDSEYQPTLTDRLALAAWYQRPQLSQGFALCSQWPDPCTAADPWFLDGGNTDGPSLAGNIARHHASLNATGLNQTLKVIVTLNNYYSDTNMRFLSYFATWFNQGVAPGDWIWPPNAAAAGTLFTNPWRSMQIFADALDDAAFRAQCSPVGGNTNVTTAVLSAKTLENTAFGVKAGQRVRLLVLQLNSGVPTRLFTARQVAESRGPLVSLSRDILENAVLRQRIQDFVAGAE